MDRRGFLSGLIALAAAAAGAKSVLSALNTDKGPPASSDIMWVEVDGKKYWYFKSQHEEEVRYREQIEMEYLNEIFFRGQGQLNNMKS